LRAPYQSSQIANKYLGYANCSNQTWLDHRKPNTDSVVLSCRTYLGFLSETDRYRFVDVHLVILS